MTRTRGLVVSTLCLVQLLGAAATVRAQAPLRKIGELDLAMLGLRATLDRQNLTVPKNIATGIPIAVRAGSNVIAPGALVRLLGGPYSIEGELAGPGLGETLTLKQTGPTDATSTEPLLLPVPSLAIAGGYTLSNLRLVVGNRPVLDVTPRVVPLEVIDQVLITSVKTRPLTLQEIKDKGIVLDKDDYLAFEFTLGVKLESKPVNITFPVVFDRAGVPLPEYKLPAVPVPVLNEEVPAFPEIVPVMLRPPKPIMVNLGDRQEEVKIPSVIVIPGNVGYLKQFFSAQLFVANGAPKASGLTVRKVTGTMRLPKGADLELGTSDDPLSPAETVKGVQPMTMPVRGAGPDGAPDTADDVDQFAPGEQGMTEFLIRGDREGFHNLGFDISATLDGLPTGPVTVTGQATGGVLVRNPYFDMTFTVPSVVRKGERFKVYASVTNIGQGLANDVSVTIDSSRLSGARIVGEATRRIDTLLSGDSKMLKFEFDSNVTGQVVASYLHLDTQNGSTGQLKFTLGVGERGVVLSPDTLVLPAQVAELPEPVVDAAMRVLGQAWSVANAAPGTLPKGVVRVDRNLVKQKALALAEGGLRVTLGEPLTDALQNLLPDFAGGTSITPGSLSPGIDAGFDQILRETSAGHAFRVALGDALSSASAADPLAFERRFSELTMSGPDFIALTVANGSGAAPVDVSIVDGANRRTNAASSVDEVPQSQVRGASLVPLGPPATSPLLGMIAAPAASPYRLDLVGRSSGSMDVAITVPRADGTFDRAHASGVSVTAGGRSRVVIDLLQSVPLVLEQDGDGDGTYETQVPMVTAPLAPQSPRLLSATVIGPETLPAAGPFGVNVALLFDRIVEPASANALTNYSMPRNGVRSAKRQLSGRLVFASLDQPEGPYVPATITVDGIADGRGTPGTRMTKTLGSLLQDPGAVVSGRILNPDGTPVVGAIVTYQNNPNWQTCETANVSMTGLAAVTTDTSGRYEFRYVWQDRCGFPWAMITQDEKTGSIRTASGHVRTAGEQIVLDMVLFGTGTLTGVVRDLTGAPVADATVVAVSDTDPRIGGQARSDGDGRYTISNLLVGAISVKAVHRLVVGTGATRIARAGTTASLDIVLNSGSVHVTGTVQRLEGGVARPAVGVYVSYKLNDGLVMGGRRVAVASTKADGSYAFDLVPAGSYIVDAVLETGDRAAVTGIATAGDDLTHNLVIEIARNARVSGIVKFPDGTPAAGVVVTITNRGVLSAADGTFDLKDVPVQPNSPQMVQARTQDARRTGRRSVVINSSGQHVSDVVVTLSGLGTAEFIVLDASGQPMAGQDVMLLYTAESVLAPSCVLGCGCALAVARTNAAGRVQFFDIPPGPAKARAMRIAAGMADVVEGIALVPRDGETGTAVLRFGGVGAVSGIVYDPDGRPAFGADIELNSVHFDLQTCALTPGPSHRMRTDTAGRFRFSSVNVGPVYVNASQAFFPTRVAEHGTLLRDGDQLTFTLRLVNTISGELSGTVFLPDGQTPAGAGVEVTAKGPLPDVTVTTNDAGHYRFAKIFPEGRYSLTVRDPVTGGVGYESVYIKAQQDAVHDMRLKGRGTVNVHVVDGGGVEVPSAFVHLQESSFPNRTYDGAVEDANGRVVTFPSVFEGPFSVQATDRLGRGGRTSAVLVGPDATLDVTVRLTVTGTVRGRFLMPDRTTPIPFGGVRLTAGGRIVGQTVTRGGADAGVYEFTYVPAGDVRIEADDPITARRGVAVGRITTEGELLALDIVATGIGTVEGFATSNGSPRSGAHVDIVSGSFRAGTFTGSDGHYIVVGVPEGKIVATASLPGGALTGTASATLTGDGTTLTLDVPLRDSGIVTGRVVAFDGQTPAPPSAVSIQVGGVGGGTEQTTTNVDGGFRFDRVPAGHATLTVDVLGSIDQGATTVDVVGNTTSTADVTLNGVGSLTGTARDSANNPIEGDLTITGTGAFRYSVTLRTGADGSYAVPQLLAGPVTLSLRSRVGALTLYGSASGTIAAGSTPTAIDIRLQDTGTVTGLVLRADGTTPAVGTNVTVTLDQYRGVVRAQALADGRFTVTGVPLGGFTTTFSDPITTGVARSPRRGVDANLQIVELDPIVLDDTPVAVVSVDPAEGATGVLPTRAVRVVLSDAITSTSGLSIQTASGTVVATAASISSDGLTVTFTGTLPELADLTVSMTTAFTDTFGRHPSQAFASHFRTSDVSPPAVSAIVPAYFATQVAPSAVVQVTFTEPVAADNLASVITVKTGSVIVAGTTALVSPRVAVFTPDSPLAANAQYVVIVNGAVDTSGNRQTSAYSSYFKTIDTIAPTLTLSSPIADGWSKALRPAIQVSAADNLIGVNPATASITLDPGTPGAVTASALSLTPSSDLAEGMHTLTASVADFAGNVATLTASFGVDSVAPTAALITGLTDGQVVRDTTTIGATADDATSGVASIALYRDGFFFATLAAPPFQTSLNTRGLTEGPHTFTARATDRAGHVGPAGPDVHVTVDNTLLTVSLTAPQAGGRFVTSVVASATPSEPVDRVEFSIGPAANPNLVTVSDDTSPYSVTLPLNTVPEGSVIVTARAFAMGDPAVATRTIVVDRTPPPAPDANRIDAEPPVNGAAFVTASAGATEAGATINATNLANGASATANARADGGFAFSISAASDDQLTITATDSVGNRSAATLVVVRRTPSLPPAVGNTSLRYEGLLVDRVGTASGAIAADGAIDAVFTLSLSIGDDLTRVLSYIDLVGPATRSTRVGVGGALGVAAGAGDALLNNANGTVAFPITSSATMTLIASDGGFIQPGASYTATAVFTDGSRFVDTFTIVAPEDQTAIAHSASITADPATVRVTSSSTPGMATLTISDIRDIDGTRVPDGAKVAVTAVDMGSKDPRGVAYRSAGGTIVDGVAAANNASFKVFTVTGGAITATYSSQPVMPTAYSGALSIIQLMPADANGNVLGTQAIATYDLSLRAATDTAIGSVVPPSLFVDKTDRRGHVTFAVALPDGAKVALTADSGWAIVNGAWVSGSVGGKVLGGAPVTGAAALSAFTVSGGLVQCDYSPGTITVDSGTTKTAIISMIALNANNTVSSYNALGTATVTLVGAGAGELRLSTDNLPLVYPSRTVQAIVHHVHDARANLVPDGTKLLVTAASSWTLPPTGNTWLTSAGGSIVDGQTVPTTAFRMFPLVNGEAVATYSPDSLQADPGESKTANISVLVADKDGNIIDYRSIAYAPVKLNGVTNAAPASVTPSTLMADGAVFTSTVTFRPVLDAYGNTVPDGTNVLATAANQYATTPDGAWIWSDGGQILNGSPGPYTVMRALTVENGEVTVTYSDQSIVVNPGEIKTARVSLLAATATGQVGSWRALGTATITLVGTTAASAAVSPTYLHADGADRRATVTVTNIVDTAGRPVPDGTKIIVSAANQDFQSPNGTWITSAGGSMVGGTASTGSRKIFTVQNRQVVFEYSSQNVSVASGQKTAVIQIVAANQAGAVLSNRTIGSVSIDLLAPASASVSVVPADLYADNGAHLSQITIGNLLDAGGVPVPDGARVAVSVTDSVARDSAGVWQISAGGSLQPAGTTPGDGTVTGSYFQLYTVAGGEVRLSYSNANLSAAVNQSKVARLVVVPASGSGTVLSNTAIAIGAINLRGAGSAVAAGPLTASRGGSPVQVTFSGIKDTAGNVLPDGALVAVTVTGNTLRDPATNSYLTSAGGAITDGTPAATYFRLFPVHNGAVTVTYSAATASTGTATIAIAPALATGGVNGSTAIPGGIWRITVQ